MYILVIQTLVYLCMYGTWCYRYLSIDVLYLAGKLPVGDQCLSCTRLPTCELHGPKTDFYMLTKWLRWLQIYLLKIEDPSIMLGEFRLRST